MKKSVIFLVQNLPVPQDRRVWMEAQTLRQNGFQVSVISPRNPNQKKFEIIDGVFIYRYLKPPKSSGYLSYLWEYAYSFINTLYLSFKIYLTRGFSAIHSANPPDFFFLIAVPFKLFGVKFIYDQHDLMPEMLLCKFGKSKKSWLYKFLLFMERSSYNLSDAHIATCLSGQEVALTRVKPKPKNFIVRSAPDLGVINEKSVQKKLVDSVKKRFAHVACYLGVMGPQDGVDKLLRSIKIIVRDLGRKDAGFIIMGDGDDLDRLKKMSATLGISEHVIFTGWADAKIISSYFSASQIGLMPEPKNDYTDNSLHNKVLEYMSFGLPVVAYELKEAQRSAEKAAVFVENNDEEAFARAVVELFDTPEKRKAMGEIGKERVKVSFQKEMSQKELIKAYDSLF